ncbi:M48 family metalloprotease [Flavivirga eckloniae]|uniref:Peptidase M48 domain-containing protein n=1 Tax=Flavivirga eckloniae TaxID=1803846 RepID=A0A2K9PLQ8_9FLAO|nr:M48 family metalloprotease [Flavivirga eckloniae]AUP78004.1 hypothetical protein C1H87_04465 [Flavivirga eckloniae]
MDFKSIYIQLCITVLFSCSTRVVAQKEEIWKEATVFEFNKPYETITVNYDGEEFVLDVTRKTKFLLGEKKYISKEKIFIGSIVDVAIVIESRKRVLTKVSLNKDEYGDIKKFEGVIESYKGDTAIIDGRKVALTDKTTIKCNGGSDCACSKGRSFLGFNELQLGSFLTVYVDRNDNGVYMASKIEVCKNTYGKVDQEFMLSLSNDFDATNLNQFKSIPSNVFKAANGLHNGTIKLGNLEFKLLDDIRVQGYINMIGNNVLPVYAKEESFSKEHKVIFRFYVIESDIPNAFALPNGMIFINTGLLKLMENEAQLAAVLGHEIAHVTHEHSIKEYKITRFTNSNIGKKTSKWLKQTVKKKMNVGEGTLVGKALNTALERTIPETVMNLYSKRYETQSDRVGLYYMIEAGYDPREAANFWKIMMKKTSDRKFKNNIFTSTLSMINNIRVDEVDYSVLTEDGIDILVESLLETIYTSHPLVIKRLGDINYLLSTTYRDKDFSLYDINKGEFDQHFRFEIINNKLLKKYYKAEKMYDKGNNLEKKNALRIWLDIEDDVISSKENLAFFIKLYKNIAKAYLNLNEIKLSILYFKKINSLKDKALNDDLYKILSSDSLIEDLNRNSASFDETFILKTKRIILEETGSKKLADMMKNSNQCFETLETLAYFKEKVKMNLTSKKEGTKVFYRRWVNRNNEKAWKPVFTDKTFPVSRARYQVKYMKNGIEIIEDLPCSQECHYQFN